MSPWSWTFLVDLLSSSGGGMRVPTGSATGGAGDEGTSAGGVTLAEVEAEGKLDGGGEGERDEACDERADDHAEVAADDGSDEVRALEPSALAAASGAESVDEHRTPARRSSPSMFCV
jgi:hypothetical protein